MRWRFVSSPLDMPYRNIGGYIRITLGNRELPTYIVRRSFSNNWGFVLENCWGIFTSFNVPLKLEIHDTEQDNFNTVENYQWKEALLYNFGANKLPEGEQGII